MASELIYKVTNVDCDILKSNPPILKIIAEGQTRTGGWTKIRLSQYVYVDFPPDGYWEFDFLGDPPPQGGTSQITDVKTAFDWKDPPLDRLKGVKVYAETNGIKYTLATKKSVSFPRP